MRHVFSFFDNFDLMGQMRNYHNKVRNTLQKNYTTNPCSSMNSVTPIRDDYAKNERRQIGCDEYPFYKIQEEQLTDRLRIFVQIRIFENII